MIYEYKTEKIEGYWIIDTFESKVLEICNKLAKDGWELVSTCSVGYKTISAVLIFKRKIG